jgi:5-methylcytosine-specific restriction endonuclease McrA
MMRPCAQPACPAVVAKGNYCVRHARQREQRRNAGRLTAHQRGYTKRWVRYSAQRLREFPFCAICGNLAQVTDHIIPAVLEPSQFWTVDNHQSLCSNCNRRKAMAEGGALARSRPGG